MTTIDDIRLANLQILVLEFDTVSALAEAARTSEKYLGQLLRKELLPSGRRRTIGGELARKLEDAGIKSRGWMDKDHTDDGDPIAARKQPIAAAELNRLFKMMTTKQRRAALNYMRESVRKTKKGNAP